INPARSEMGRIFPATIASRIDCAELPFSLPRRKDRNLSPSSIAWKVRWNVLPAGLTTAPLTQEGTIKWPGSGGGGGGISPIIRSMRSSLSASLRFEADSDTQKK